MSDFGLWSNCTLACGGGVQTRSKTILRHGEYGGHECPGTDQVQPCNEQPCPVDCQVTQWSSWSECSVSCGGGMTYQARSIKQQPSFGGAACPSPLNKTAPCNVFPCFLPISVLSKRPSSAYSHRPTMIKLRVQNHPMTDALLRTRVVLAGAAVEVPRAR